MSKPNKITKRKAESCPAINTIDPLTPYDILLHYYSYKDLFQYACYLDHTFSSMPFLNQEHADTETYYHT